MPGELSWDEMGERGLHKALNEYYKLSASQKNMRMCGMRAGGAPGLLCTLVHSLVIPQLPAALSPPALLGALAWLLYAAAWLLYHSAAVTIPLALWLVLAADGRLALGSSGAAAVEAAALLHPAAGAAMARMQTAAAELPAHPAAVALLALGLLVMLRAAEGAVLRRRQERWQLRQRRITAADVQARYSAWALPGSSSIAPGAGDAAAAAAAARQQQRRQQVLDVLRGEVGALWHAVYGGESLPADQLRSLQGGWVLLPASVLPRHGGRHPAVKLGSSFLHCHPLCHAARCSCRCALLSLPADLSGAVARLCKDTGVELPTPAAADSGRMLLDVVHRVKQAVGVA